MSHLVGKSGLFFISYRGMPWEYSGGVSDCSACNAQLGVADGGKNVEKVAEESPNVNREGGHAF